MSGTPFVLLFSLHSNSLYGNSTFDDDDDSSSGRVKNLQVSSSIIFPFEFNTWRWCMHALRDRREKRKFDFIYWEKFYYYHFHLLEHFISPTVVIDGPKINAMIKTRTAAAAVEKFNANVCEGLLLLS
jgi:hypothetical protein